MSSTLSTITMNMGTDFDSDCAYIEACLVLLKDKDPWYRTMVIDKLKRYLIVENIKPPVYPIH